MDANIRQALGRSQLIGMTTTGARSGEARRIDVGLHSMDGRIFISGMPRADRKRAWIANLEHDPRLTIHLKSPIRADVPATARVITDPQERRAALESIARSWGRNDVDEMVAHSPLIEVTVQADRT
jgi:deazaflavin-dependent oxidoreductase (nitroreductase family)